MTLFPFILMLCKYVYEEVTERAAVSESLLISKRMNYRNKLIFFLISIITVYVCPCEWATLSS